MANLKDYGESSILTILKYTFLNEKNFNFRYYNISQG